MCVISHLKKSLVLLFISIIVSPCLSGDNKIEEYLISIPDSISQGLLTFSSKDRQTQLKNYLNIPPEAQIEPIWQRSNHSIDNWYLVRINTSRQDHINAIAQLQQNKTLAHIQQNNHFRIHGKVPNDPLYDQQWYLQKVKAVEAWEHFEIDPEIILAIIDTGIDYEHPDLDGQLWVNSAEDLNHNGILDENDLNGIDDDLNGFVDDVIGWDFTDAPRFADGGDFIDPDNDPMDEYQGGHGTRIAGIITAIEDNHTGISGLTPGATVMNIRAGTASGYLEEDDVARAVLYAVDNGAKVINMSFGDIVISRFLQDVVSYAYHAGVVIVASAGNSGTDQIHYPSGLSETISVGATDAVDQLAGFSNWGQTIDLVAPGVDIISTEPGGSYGYAGGTSFSAPIVTAAAGLVLSKNPDLGVEQVRNLLKTSADDIGYPGFDSYFGAGRINLLNLSLLNKSSSLVMIHPASGSSVSGDSLPIIVNAQDPDLLKVHLAYGYGKNPESWNPLIQDYLYQVIHDTIAVLPINSIPDTTLVFRLSVDTWQGETMEYRSIVEIDHTKPVLSDLKYFNILHENNYASLIEFETDDITSANFCYREQGSTGSFHCIPLEYATRNHHFLFIESGTFEFFIEVQNLSGRAVKEDNQGNFFKLKNSGSLNAQVEFKKTDMILPDGYLLSNAADFDMDGNLEIVLSEYDAFNSFGPVAIYEYAGGQFEKQFETAFSAIPRDWGDSDNDGKMELLLGYGQQSYLLEATNVGEWPSQTIWSDSGAFWVSRISDLDKDGHRELVGKEGQQFVLYENSADNQYQRIYAFPNPSEGLNQLGPPRCEIADLDKDGRLEIIYGDYDGDLIIYENVSDNHFEYRGSITLPLSDATNYFVLDTVSSPGDQLLIAGSHSGEQASYEHEFDALYWNYSIIRALADNHFQITQNIPVFGYSGIRDFGTGVNSASLVDGIAGMVFIAPYPDFYAFKSNGDSLIPVWYQNGVNTNTILAVDLDGSGIREIYFSDGDHIAGYSSGTYTGPDAPDRVMAYPLDTLAIQLTWREVTGADNYLIYRGFAVDSLVLYDSTRFVEYLDSAVTQDIRYFYALRTVDRDLHPDLSHLSVKVSVIPNPAPGIDTIMVKNDHQVEIHFNEIMDQNTLRLTNFQVENHNISLTSVISFLNGQAALLSFSDIFYEDTLYKFSCVSVRDTNRTELRPSHRQQSFYYFGDIGSKPYVKEWIYQDQKTLMIRFNVPMEEILVLEPSNYILEPSGNVLSVERVSGSSTAYQLNLSADTYLSGSGITTYLTLNNLAAENGSLFDEGNRIALIVTPLSIDDLYVFPQPASTMDEWLVFANIAPGTSIRIYDTNGRFIRTISEEDQNGGIRWDLKNQSGQKVASGIYIFYAIFGKQTKLGKFSIVN